MSADTMTGHFLNDSNESRLKIIMERYQLPKPILMGEYNTEKNMFINLLNPFNNTGFELINLTKDLEHFEAIDKDFLPGITIDRVYYEGLNHNTLIDKQYYIFKITPFGFDKNSEEEKRHYKKDAINNDLKKVLKVESIEDVFTGDWDDFLRDTFFYKTQIDLKNCNDYKSINDNSIEDKKKILYEIKNQLEKSNQEKKELDKQIKKSEKRLIEFSIKFTSLENVEKEFKTRFEESIDNTYSENNPVEFHPTKAITDVNNEDINSLRMSIYKNLGLIYNPNTIDNIIRSLGLGKEVITILYGSSGTGKTSLIRAISEQIGAEYKIIPVQSSWLDSQELLGYYNPLSQLYIPTDFLDAIVDAQRNPKQLYLICLDELNLSQVELYLADILSIMEHSSTIKLYSESEYTKNLEELKYFMETYYDYDEKNNIYQPRQSNEPGLDFYKKKLKYEQLSKNLVKFGHEVVIPDNVRFLGTMNVDGTTKVLSPKVIDRSYLIELKKQSLVNNGNLETSAASILPLVLSNDAINKERLDHKYLNDYKTLFERLEGISININNRTENQILHLETLYRETGESNDLFIRSNIIYNKILPKIDQYIEEVDPVLLNEIAESIEVLASSKSDAYQKFNKMIDNYNKNKIFSFWR